MMVRIALIFGFVIGLATTVAAGVNPEIAIALHIDEESLDCDTFWLPDCFAIQTSSLNAGRVIQIDVVICGHGWTGDGFMGAWYGLTWPEEWGPALGWLSCAPMTVGTIESPGDYVEQHWPSCIPPVGWPELSGVLTLHAITPGQVLVTIHGERGTAGVDDCHAGFDLVLPCGIGNGRAGWVTVGPGPDAGCNPCPCVGPPCYQPPSAAEGSAWSEIKALFK
jgi:hypothetical protein